MNNRVAFIDFVRGLLCINPMERWSPQQAKMHPFITQQKYTGPFVPPMNLKNNSPLQKSPMSSIEQQQRAEQAARQKQQQQQQQAQAQAQAQAHAQQQAAHAAQASSAYSGVSLGNYHNQGQQPQVFNNNLYNTPHQQQAAVPPAYPSGGQYGGMVQQQHPQQTNQYQPSHSSLYPQNSRRQRSTTMMDGIPPQIQRAASMMDPNHPIRLQPSPAYYPPPPGGLPDEPNNSRHRGGRQGNAQYRNRDVIRQLEDRTLEDGLFNNQRWA
jgi:dual specificity protein kinase YAK1